MYEKLEKILHDKKADAILVSDGYNMHYISGFRGATGYLYLTGQRKVLMTDSRYTTQASEETEGYEILEAGGGTGYAELLGKQLAKDHIRAICYEDNQMICADFHKLREACGKAEWVPLGDSLNSLRMVKTEVELAKIANAQSIADKAFSYILDEIKPGVTELAIAAKLEYFMKEQGASGTSFDTIVASGLHSAMPHAIPSEKKIREGDFVTMDFGCIWDGYCSDMTRTVVVGKASEKQKEIYSIVLEAQRAALHVIRAGLTGAQVDKAARDLIAGAGYGEYFGHGLGHGVGLFIHEEPRLSPNCHTKLEKGMIQTVEPGIYLPEFGGVRIEDMVVITEDGCRNFTQSPKELIQL